MEPLRDLPFVGRADERARLAAFLAAVGGGSGQAVFVQGGAGVGKTRLVETALAGADGDLRIARGQAFGLEASTPYGVFAEALAPLLRSLDPAQLDILTRGWSQELAVLLPGVLPVPVAEGAIQALTSDEAVHRLRWILADLLQRLGELEPLVLVLDDLQWADDSSLDLLHFLCRSLDEEGSVGILGVVRAGGGEETPLALTEIQRSLVGLGRLNVVSLGPLAQSEIEELLAGGFHLSGNTRTEVARDLHEWTGGNPLYLREVLRGWVEHGLVHREGEVWVGWSSRAIVLPEALETIIRSRVARLPEDAISLLEKASALGQEVPQAVLQGVSGDDRAGFLRRLDLLVDGGFLVEVPEARVPAYRFAHPVQRAAVYEGISGAGRRELHTQIAATLRDQDGSATPFELAAHLLRGDHATLSESDATTLLSAGEAAAGLHADGMAERYFRASIEAGVGGAGSGRAALGLARSLHRQGEYAAGDQILRGLLAGARERGDRAGAAELLRRLGMAEYWRGRRIEALEILGEGLVEAAAAEDAALVARIEAARGAAFQEMGRLEEAAAALRAGLASLGEEPDLVLAARLQRALFLASAWAGDADGARTHGEAAEAAARQADNPDLAWSIQWVRAVVTGLRGNGVEFLRTLEALRALDEAVRSPVRRLLLYELETQYCWASGQWDEGLVVGEEAVELARTLDQPPLLARMLVWTASFLLRRGDLERGEAYVREAWALAEERSGEVPDIHARVSAHAGMALFAMETADYAEASRLAELGLALARQVGFVAWGTFRLLPVLTESLFREGRVEEGAALGRTLRAEATTLGHALGVAWADAADALAAWLGAGSADAARMLELAADALEAIPMLPDAARVRRQAAGRWAELEERDRAVAALKRVHDQFEAMGAVPELEKTRQMFREVGARPPVRGSEEGVAGLTEREMEIAQAASEGRSNKAIAKALGISPRTVGTHLSRIYRKLGVASRAALASALVGGG